MIPNEVVMMMVTARALGIALALVIIIALELAFNKGQLNEDRIRFARNLHKFESVIENEV